MLGMQSMIAYVSLSLAADFVNDICFPVLHTNILENLIYFFR